MVGRAAFFGQARDCQPHRPHIFELEWKVGWGGNRSRFVVDNTSPVRISVAGIRVDRRTVSTALPCDLVVCWQYPAGLVF